VEVRTWVSHFRGLFAVRNFRILVADGAVAGHAATRWCLIDTERRRAVRLPAWMIEAFPIDPRRDLEDAFKDPTPVDEAVAERSFRVRGSDLDVNRHAYSAHYIGWVLESVPEDCREKYAPAEVEIAYKSEAREGDELIVLSQAVEGAEEEGTAFRHMIRRRGDVGPIALGRSRWRREGNAS
jgi:acyl-ACP thioesterase